MEEILSVIQNLLEIILFYINPVSFIEFNLEEITLLGKATAAMTIGGMFYPISRKMGADHKSALIIATCLGLMGVAAMPDPVILFIIILYCAVSRIFDGYGTGYVIGSWFRKPFSGAACILAFDLDIAQIHQIYSYLSMFLGVYGVYKLFMRMPAINESKAFALSMGIFSVLGTMMMPIFGSAFSFFILMLYPLFLIVGILSGIKTSSAY